jgi:hypothetical protein
MPLLENKARRLSFGGRAEVSAYAVGSSLSPPLTATMVRARTNGGRSSIGCGVESTQNCRVNCTQLRADMGAGAGARPPRGIAIATLTFAGATPDFARATLGEIAATRKK